MTPQTKREYLRDLVLEKNRWARSLTEAERARGFLGWHERGYLPHCDFPGLIQFITFRLADSMPELRRGEWEHLLKIEDKREQRTKLEAYLDRGVGACCLRNARIAKITEDALLHFHHERYELLAWCVMPNHVHVLVHVGDWPLAKILQSWKRFVGLWRPKWSAGLRPGVFQKTTPPRRLGERRFNGSENIGTLSCAMRPRKKPPFVTSRATR